MTGYNTIATIQRLEALCDELGFKIGHSKHDYMKTFGDTISLYPKDEDALPHYSRDAEIFIGTLESLEDFIQGIKWARGYDIMVFGHKHDEKREKAEQRIRNQKLMQTIKDSSK